MHDDNITVVYSGDAKNDGEKTPHTRYGNGKSSNDLFEREDLYVKRFLAKAKRFCFLEK